MCSSAAGGTVGCVMRGLCITSTWAVTRNQCFDTPNTLAHRLYISGTRVLLQNPVANRPQPWTACGTANNSPLVHVANTHPHKGHPSSPSPPPINNTSSCICGAMAEGQAALTSAAGHSKGLLLQQTPCNSFCDGYDAVSQSEGTTTCGSPAARKPAAAVLLPVDDVMQYVCRRKRNSRIALRSGVHFNPKQRAGLKRITYLPFRQIRHTRLCQDDTSCKGTKPKPLEQGHTLHLTRVARAVLKHKVQIGTVSTANITALDLLRNT